MKKIRLTESDLENIVRKAFIKAINEIKGDNNSTKVADVIDILKDYLTAEDGEEGEHNKTIETDDHTFVASYYVHNGEVSMASVEIYDGNGLVDEVYDVKGMLSNAIKVITGCQNNIYSDDDPTFLGGRMKM